MSGARNTPDSADPSPAPLRGPCRSAAHYMVGLVEASPVLGSRGSRLMASPQDKVTGKPRLLDLFCGAGGATRGYQLAGFHVTGVDINPQPHYVGDDFMQADVMDPLIGGLLELYDAI